MILLTGAAGFLGKHVLWELLEGPEALRTSVICVDRAEQAGVLDRMPELKAFRWEFGDLEDPEFVRRVFANAPITAVAHVAAEVHHHDPAQASARDLRVLSLLVEQGNLPLLFISSLDVVRERSDPYAYSKRVCEYMISERVNRYIIIRSPLMYGPYDTKNCDAIFRWVQRRSWIPTFGNGESRMTPVFVRDLARVIVAVLEQRLFPNQIFSIAGQDVITWNQLIDGAATRFGKRIFKLRVPQIGWAIALRLHQLFFRKPFVNPDVLYTLFQDRVYEGSRLNRQLGISFSSLDRGLTVTCESYKAGHRREDWRDSKQWAEVR